jgi:alkanesulfonate monooxygenase SsuD/methylene tetrahydromethanopterin reductase-like flavin-dependent oxidoreductase (luciferase family)
LDVISGGRVVLGVGAGWLREETEAFGTNFVTRWKRLRETTEAMRVLWTEKECSYQGDLVKFPPVRCEPKPVQKPGPPILLGALGPKALERVARTYDGWCPAAGKPGDLKRDAETIRKLAAGRGRDPKRIRIEPFAAPPDEGISLDDLKRFKEAGVDRLILFSQRDAVRMAHGRALEVIRRLAPTVERAQHV